MRRKIVRIDEEKCDGCGQCVPACAEGAIQLIDGKARLVSDVYCDGLGACLGGCPQGAITIEEREAEAFDEEASSIHVAQTASQGGPPPGGCPGMVSHMLHRSVSETDEGRAAGGAVLSSRLGNWPVQLSLVPVHAPYFEGAEIVIAADCVPFAFAGFHRRFLTGKVLIIGCPKLDDAGEYRRKLADLFRQNNIKSIEVVHMEVPCCFGLNHLVGLALEDSGKDIPLTATEVSIHGEVKGKRAAQDVA